MSDATEKADALKQLQRYVPIDVVPKLNDDDYKDALAANQRARTWAIDTQYNLGDVMQPPSPNGRRYVCEQPGTSAHVDPGFWFWPRSTGGTVQETATPPSDPALVWREMGPQYPSVYDVRQAAYELWDLKAQKATQFIKDGDLDYEQVYTHCCEMRDSLAPVGCS